MKSILKSLFGLLTVIGLNSSFSQSQNNSTFPANPEIKLLIRAYGYLNGQKFTLNRIKKEFPTLEIAALKAESEFNLNFKKGGENITSHLKELIGKEYQNFESTKLQQIASILGKQNITEDLARQFVSDVNDRAKGKIESPVKETLLTYQYIDNPVQEFSSGFVNAYSTKNHSKSKNLEIATKLPLSWSKSEGERPNVVQTFISENGNGTEVIILLIKEFQTSGSLQNIFTESELKKFATGEGAEPISAKEITIDNQKGGQIIFKMEGKRLDNITVVQGIMYVTLFRGKLIFLQCMVSKDNRNLNERFKLFLPLFNQVANSIVLMDQY